MILRKAVGQQGQAMVESAIVLPMYVFLILGLIQLGLLYQARMMTKYAAYRAVRAGSLNNAKLPAMEDAAMAALLPLLSNKAMGQDAERIEPITGPASFISKYGLYRTATAAIEGVSGFAFMIDGVPLRYAEITICGPTKDMLGSFSNYQELDFDDPMIAAAESQGQSGWKHSQYTKLRIQLTFNYRMPIPFANRIIYAFAIGKEVSSALRLGTADPGFVSILGNLNAYQLAAERDVFIMPIRANYAMRMQSNVYMNQIPQESLCRIPFDKKS